MQHICTSRSLPPDLAVIAFCTAVWLTAERRSRSAVSMRKAAIGIRPANVQRGLASPMGRFCGFSISKPVPSRRRFTTKPIVLRRSTWDCSGQRKNIYLCQWEPEWRHKGITPDPKHQQRPTFDKCSTAFLITYERRFQG